MSGRFICNFFKKNCVAFATGVSFNGIQFVIGEALNHRARRVAAWAPVNSLNPGDKAEICSGLILSRFSPVDLLCMGLFSKFFSEPIGSPHPGALPAPFPPEGKGLLRAAARVRLRAILTLAPCLRAPCLRAAAAVAGLARCETRLVHTNPELSSSAMDATPCARAPATGSRRATARPDRPR